ncbi:hypothetical protein ACFQL4_17170 [Halosimplex aquaticum]
MTGADLVAESADSLRERAGENRVKLWLFIEADRRLVAAAAALFVFGSLATIGALVSNPIALLRSGDPVETTFQALLGAIITGVTLVVTLNQLVLSQEFGTIDQQRDRFGATMSVRESVGDHVDPEIAPSDPSRFVRSIVSAAADDADAARAATHAGTPADASAAVAALADGIRSNADVVTEQLDGASFGTFDVLSAALDFNYSAKIYEARRIRARYADDLPDSAVGALDELLATLELFAPAREHVKTLLIQWELIDLSRYVLLSAVPALIVTLYMLLFHAPGTPADPVFGVPLAVFVVSAAVTVALVPFLVLLAYILRIASVTKRTLAIGPFTIRDTADTNE